MGLRVHMVVPEIEIAIVPNGHSCSARIVLVNVKEGRWI